MSGVLHAVTEEIITGRFPGRIALTSEEVAEVWRGSRSREAVGAIRERLSRGTLVPGLKKNGGGWDVPVEGLVKAIGKLMAGGDEDEDDPASIHPQAAPAGGTRRCAIGPRVSDTVEFWSEVFATLDMLEAEARRASLAGITVWGWQQVSESQRKAKAAQVVADSEDKTYTDDEAATLCGRDIRTLRRWCKAGKGPAFKTKKVGNYTEIVYTRDALLKWLKSQPKHQ